MHPIIIPSHWLSHITPQATDAFVNAGKRGHIHAKPLSRAIRSTLHSPNYNKPETALQSHPQPIATALRGFPAERVRAHGFP